MGNITEFQDHDHTISEESREEMATEKPWWKHYKNEIDYIMTDKPSTVTDVTVINRVNIGSDNRRRGSAVVSTSACHAGGRGSLLGPGTLLDVKTWLSTLEIVYLRVFRMRH